MKKLSIALLTVSLFILTPLFSQMVYVPGYIIHPDGDTSHVLVYNYSPGIHISQIKTRTANNAPVIKYSEKDIIGFGIDGRNFIRKIVFKDIKSRELKSLDKSRDPVLVKDTVFLEILYRGEIGLYFYRDKMGNNNLYIGSEEKPALLIYTLYMFEDYDNTYEYGNFKRENQMYKGQLIDYLKDCIELVKKINTCDYNPHSISRVFKDYYKYCGNESSKKKLRELNRNLYSCVGVLGSLNHNSLVFSGFNNPLISFNPYDYPASMNYSFGFYFDVRISASRSYFSFSNELLYDRLRINDEKLIQKDNANRYYLNQDLKNGYLKINFLFRYHIPYQQYEIFFGAGMSNCFLLSESNIDQYYKLSSGNKHELFDFSIESKKYLPGILMGIGASYRKWMFEIRYSFSTSHKDEYHYQKILANWNQLNFLLGYRILKK